MGYIKKLKNNELVGGTDKTTIYPVTSTKAVFEEVTEGDKSSFKSQETINKVQQDTLDDHEERIQAAEAEDIKSITINGSTKEFRVDDKNNVDLTIYTVDSDPEMPDIADNVRDLRNMVGTSTPVLETSHKTRIETLEGSESVTGSVENKIKTKVDSINSSYQDDNNEYVKYSMTQVSGEVTDFNIDETSLKNAITSLNTSISGDNIIVGPRPTTGLPGKIYRVINSSNNTYTDYMYSNGSWIQLAIHDTSDGQAQVAYYTCIAAGSGAQTTKQFVGSGSLTYTPSSGGHIKILMGEANTATGTIYLQFGTTTNTKKPLYYNGEPASASNTWETGETIAVYYDPSANSNAGAYFASNAQGGGGKAEKIKYDNSQSGLSAENVQGALDEITETTNIEEGGINLSTATTLADTVINFGVEPPTWRTQSERASILVPIAKGKKYKVEVASDSPSSSRICVLANSTHTIGSTPSFATGLDNYRPLVEIGQYVVFTSPNNGNYLYINNVTSQGTATVNVYEMDSVGNVVAENRNNIVALSVFDKGSGDAYITNYLIWENGAIASSTGLNTDSSTRIRTIGMHYATDNITITPSEGYQLYVIYYDENGNIAESNGWLTSETAILAGQHYRLVFAKTDSSIISPYELKNHITVTNGYVSDRLLAYKEDMRELNSCGGNLFALPEVGTSTKITCTSDGYSVTLTTTAKITANKQLRFVDLKLIEGRRYKLSFEYNFGASTSLGIRGENNVMLQALTAKLKGQGQYEGEFTYTSNMLYLSSVAYADTPSNTAYVLSNVKIYELADGNGSSYEIINMEELHEMYGCIDIRNTWKNNNISKFTLIDVSNHRGGQAVISTSANSVVAFLRDDSYLYDTLAIYANGTSRQYVNNLSDKGIYIPDDARFLYVSVTNISGDNIKPSSVILTGGYSKNEEGTEFEQIIRKRAVQLANLRWKALSNIAGTYVMAGDQTGLLYSSCVEVDRYVMFDISVKTFMTAANNPYSLLYTENLKTNVSQYGFTYYNHMSTVHAWMGTVCSRFVFFCLGYEDWDTIHLAWLCKQGILQRSKSQASQDVEIGDIIWISGHVRIIYDVINKGRQDMQIIVSEATQPLVVPTLYTPSTLDSYMSSQHGIFYKYAGERNMVYEPSEFVNNYGEPLPNDYVYNDDICTYAGDYAAFRVGYPVWLNYNLKNVGSWNKIQLYKENWSSANVMTLSLVGEYTIDTSIHKFQIPASDIAGYGKYRARMSDGNTNSAYTFFEVIDTTVSCLTPDENNTNAKKVTFSSANAGYVKVVFCNRGGTPMAIRPLTLQEKINREIIINPVETCLAQRGETLDTNNTYLKVYFKGDYGRVTNEYLKVEF